MALLAARAFFHHGLVRLLYPTFSQAAAPRGGQHMPIWSALRPLLMGDPVPRFAAFCFQSQRRQAAGVHSFSTGMPTAMVGASSLGLNQGMAANKSNAWDT